VNISNPHAKTLTSAARRGRPFRAVSRDILRIKRKSHPRLEILAPRQAVKRPLVVAARVASREESHRAILLLLEWTPARIQRERTRLFAHARSPRETTPLEISRLSIFNSRIRARAKVLVNSRGSRRDTYVMPNESRNLTRSLARSCTRRERDRNFLPRIIHVRFS